MVEDSWWWANLCSIGLYTSMEGTLVLFILSFYSIEGFLVLLTSFLLSSFILVLHKNEVANTCLQARNVNY